MAAERWGKWTTPREQRRTRASYPISAIATESPAKQSLGIFTNQSKQFLPTQMTTLTNLDNQPHPLRWPAWPTGHLNQSDDPWPTQMTSLSTQMTPLTHTDDPSDPLRSPAWPTKMTPWPTQMIPKVLWCNG